jgi:hypothetical protein
MAIDSKFKFGTPVRLYLAPTSPSTPVSGDPCRYGPMVGVCETSQDSASKQTINFGPEVFTLSVKGINAGGNSAVAAGDTLYFTDADTPPISKKVTQGTLVGIALGAVTSGGTASIDVLIVPHPV